MFGISREYVEDMKKRYPKGTRVKCIYMDDWLSPIASNTLGTVESVDDIGQIHVAWDNGRSLALTDRDSFTKVAE